MFGASGYAHFLLCLGALIPNLLVKDDGNEDAAYGTVAHWVTEQWYEALRVLRRIIPSTAVSAARPDHLVGQIRTRDTFEIEIDDAMLDFCQTCLEKDEFYNGSFATEEHVDYSDLTPIPNQGGTLDRGIMRYQWMMVRDHKFGKHEQLWAKDNYQLYLYAYGLFLRYDWLFDFQTIVVAINQPRLDHFDEWTITRQELLDFAQWAKKQMHAAWDVNAPRTAGDKQCRYCKIAASCTANAAYQVALTEGVFHEESSPEEMEAFKTRLDDDGFVLHALEVGNLSTAEIAKLHRFSKTALKFWNALPKELFRRGQLGESLQPLGLKFVESRSKRQVGDVEKLKFIAEAYDISEQELYDTKSKSPAQVEKLFKSHGVRQKDMADLFEGVFYKPAGKATLALSSDRRDQIGDLSAAAFSDESQTTETTDSEET